MAQSDFCVNQMQDWFTGGMDVTSDVTKGDAVIIEENLWFAMETVAAATTTPISTSAAHQAPEKNRVGLLLNCERVTIHAITGAIAAEEPLFWDTANDRMTNIGPASATKLACGWARVASPSGQENVQMRLKGEGANP